MTVTWIQPGRFSAGGASGFTETWPGAASDPLPADWNVLTGAVTQDGAGKAVSTAAICKVVRSSNSGTDYVLTIDVLYQASYEEIYFRSDSTQTNCCVLVLHVASGVFKYYEWDGTTATNVIDGAIALSGQIYTVEITCAGTALTIKVNTVSDIAGTMASNLSNTYVGFGQGAGAAALEVGPVSVT